MLSLHADPYAKVYRHDDPLLKELYDISVASGIVPMTSAGPVTGYDVIRQIELLKKQAQPEGIRIRLQTLGKNLALMFQEVPIHANIQVFPELYVNTDETAAEWDWVRRYNERNPFLYLEAESILADRLYGIISYGMKRRLNPEDFQGLTTSLPFYDGFKETQLQNSFPHTAFMGISLNQAALVIGRDTLGWGRGNTGNLTIGSHVPYHDFIHGSASNGLLRYTFLAIPMNEIDTNGNVIIPNTKNASAWNTLFHGSLSRLYFAHRLEVNFFPKIRVSLTEGTLFYTDRTDIRMFNPLMFMHDFHDYGEVNNTMTLELEAVLGRGWFLDFQFLLDQFQTPGEQEAYTDIPPNAFASLLGVNHIRPTSSGVFKAFVEGVYLSPYVYLRASDHTANYGGDPATQYNLDLVHAVSMRRSKGGVAFLGYLYGPDTIVGATGVSYEGTSGLGISTELRFLVRGERGLEAEDNSPENIQNVILGESELNRPTPTGIPTYFLINSTRCDYQISDGGLGIWAQIDWINTWHDASHASDVQVSIGASYQIHLFQ